MKKSIALLALAGLALPASAATYSNNFDSYADGTTDLGDGTLLQGTAQIVGGRLRLTEDLGGGGFSSFGIGALANSSQGWTMSADIEIFDSPGNNVPADGFSLNYGDFALDARGNAEEGMHEFAQNNISFEVDTWMNFDNEQGVNISGVLGGADIQDGLGAFNNGPILNDGERVTGTFTASYDAAAGTVSYVTTGLATNADFVGIPLPAGVGGNDAWNFALSGRVGGANQDVFFDNLVITTVPEPSGLALLGLSAFGFFLRRRR